MSFGPAIVTGGCGFTGAHMVDRLLAHDQKCQVHVVTRNVRNQVPGVTYHSCDISSSGEVQGVFEKVRPRIVFHMATPDSTISQPTMFQKVNVDGARNLLLAAKRVGTVHAFIYTSSSSVIHNDKTGAVNLDESMPVLGRDAQTMMYSLTKGEAEREILAANRATGEDTMLTVSIRPPMIFGERDFVCAGRMIENARQGRAHYQFGSGKNLTDVVYISNLIDALILAAEALLRAYGNAPPPPETRVDGESFLILNEKPVPFWAFQRSLVASAGYLVKEEEIRTIPLWLAFVVAAISELVTWVLSLGKKNSIISRHTVRASTIERTFNGEKARRVLGYKPKVSIEEGVARTGRWFQEQEIKRSAEAKKII
ncbi:erg26, C-3 sterol dehydrogenase [Diaporthe eres]|uniref:Erg26, C-3 sterol dehydrogenase n=1 Tax=Diaporthe eres TaxID=83184 RepID=A0ABR1PI07_DIAER